MQVVSHCRNVPQPRRQVWRWLHSARVGDVWLESGCPELRRTSGVAEHTTLPHTRAHNRQNFSNFFMMGHYIRRKIVFGHSKINKSPSATNLGLSPADRWTKFSLCSFVLHEINLSSIWPSVFDCRRYFCAASVQTKFRYCNKLENASVVTYRPSPCGKGNTRICHLLVWVISRRQA